MACSVKELSIHRTILVLGVFLGLFAAVDSIASQETGKETATFAGGCFWCVEHLFDDIKGVVSTTSGYMGGSKDNPTYHQVSAGSTGHAEVVQVLYDPNVVTFAELLARFWVNIDPTTPNQQFCDIGSQYRPAIFFHTLQQQKLAEYSRKILENNKPFPEPVVTKVFAATAFYPAESYHQNYHIKNPVRYKLYRLGCGRDRRLRELWKTYDANQLIEALQP